MTKIEIVKLDDVSFSHRRWKWPFAEQRRADIAAHFAERLRETPEMFNGRVLLANEHTLDNAILRGSFFETGFADFLAWRDWNFPDMSVRNCFAMGAIRGSDGGYLLGEMGQHTSSAGNIYFPAGTPDPGDIAGQRVDLAGSVSREVHEETGLTQSDYEVQPGWTAVFAGPRIALMRELRASLTADALRGKIMNLLSQQATPELIDIHIVRSAADFNDRMPVFMTAFLHHALAG
ncbi:MAG: NUDIX hydrolase [Xanthobacteraceae bacterium]